MAGYPPGPWRTDDTYARDYDGNSMIAVEAADGNLVASTYDAGIARLIAAAPAPLAACRALPWAHDQPHGHALDGDTIAAARAAIDGAEGR